LWGGKKGETREDVEVKRRRRALLYLYDRFAGGRRGEKKERVKLVDFGVTSWSSFPTFVAARDGSSNGEKEKEEKEKKGGKVRWWWSAAVGELLLFFEFWSYC